MLSSVWYSVYQPLRRPRLRHLLRRHLRHSLVVRRQHRHHVTFRHQPTHLRRHRRQVRQHVRHLAVPAVPEEGRDEVLHLTLAVEVPAGPSGPWSRRRRQGGAWGHGVVDGEGGRGAGRSQRRRPAEAVCARVDLRRGRREDGGDGAEATTGVEGLLDGFRDEEPVHAVDDAVRPEDVVEADYPGRPGGQLAGL
ncbi:mRNA 3'-end-processing protein RNA14 [Striga asiatica]|uniref:mRNA 3'-end-processing protein RNA14 n=1 Tax=Striga asiatica TaxID=4170 RepID=A0A5A7QIY4_STRAF|nr:mRNA 3'-end-processing protein RNA14 [Striga asiatica]